MTKTDAFAWLTHWCAPTLMWQYSRGRYSYLCHCFYRIINCIFWHFLERKDIWNLTEQETSDSRRSGCSSFRRPRFFRGVEGAESSSAPGGVSVQFLWVESGEESFRSRFFWETRLSASPLHPACFIQATPSITRPQLSTYQERKMQSGS